MKTVEKEVQKEKPISKENEEIITLKNQMNELNAKILKISAKTKKHKGLEFVKGLDKIIILAQGPSWYQVPDEVPEGTEIWGSNVIYRDYPNADRIFFGHDVRGHFFEDDIDLWNNLNAYGAPIYTLGPYARLKHSARIPVLEIIETWKTGFFLTTIAYMVATAILQEPKSIDFYGVDMRPDAGNESYGNEKGGVEFWLGIAMGKGIPFKNTLESYILKEKQEGFFPNFKPKVEQNGLIHTIPKEHRNFIDLKKYVILPIGEEI